MKAEGECGQSLPRRRGGPVINIPYPLCLGLPLRYDTGAPYLERPSFHPYSRYLPRTPSGENPVETPETPLAPSS